MIKRTDALADDAAPTAASSSGAPGHPIVQIELSPDSDDSAVASKRISKSIATALRTVDSTDAAPSVGMTTVTGKTTAATSALADRLFLSAITLLVLVGVGVLLVTATQRSHARYEQAMSAAATAAASPGDQGAIGMAYLLQFARAADAAIVKTASLFLGFSIVILGCLFVLKGVEAAYRLGIDHGSLHSSLKTSSPGLVLITLGIALVVITLFVQTTFTMSLPLRGGAGAAGPAQATAPPAGETDHGGVPDPQDLQHEQEQSEREYQSLQPTSR